MLGPGVIGEPMVAGPRDVPGRVDVGQGRSARSRPCGYRPSRGRCRRAIRRPERRRLRRRRRRSRSARRSRARARSTRPLPWAAESLCREEHAAALVAMHADEPAADVGAEDVGERQIERLDDRHVGSLGPGGGCDLLADEAGADDRQVGAGSGLGPETAGVVEGPQRERVRESFEHRQRSGPPRRSRSGGRRSRGPSRRRAPGGARRGSRPAARRPRISSTSLSAYQPASRKRTISTSSRASPSPARNPFESGGRS